MTNFEYYSNLIKYKKNDINSKLYEGDITIAHAGTYKYYNKIELPGGGTRYFYTKEEWDAYNNGIKSTNKVIADSGNKSRKYSLDQGTNYGYKPTAVEKAKDSAYYNKLAKTDVSNQVVKEGFVKKNLGGLAKKIRSDIADAPFIPDSHKKAIKTGYKSKMDALENKYKERAEKIDPEDYDYPFRSKVRDIDFDDFIESEAVAAGNKLAKDYANSQDKDASLRNAGKIMAEMFDNLDKAIDEDLTKREESIKAWDDLRKTYDKYLPTLQEDLKNMSAYEKRILADEMGIDSFDDDDIFKKYNLIDSINDFEQGDDYGASQFKEQAENVKQLWNDYKEAKKALK